MKHTHLCLRVDLRKKGLHVSTTLLVERVGEEFDAVLHRTRGVMWPVVRDAGAVSRLGAGNDNGICRKVPAQLNLAQCRGGKQIRRSAATVVVG